MATEHSPSPQPILARPQGRLCPAESVARVDPLSPHVCSPSAPGPGQSHHGDRPQGPSQSTALTGEGEGQHAGVHRDQEHLTLASEVVLEPKPLAGHGEPRQLVPPEVTVPRPSSPAEITAARERLLREPASSSTMPLTQAETLPSPPNFPTSPRGEQGCSSEIPVRTVFWRNSQGGRAPLISKHVCLPLVSYTWCASSLPPLIIATDAPRTR